MKKLMTLFFALVASSALWAADFEVDGITYNFLDGDSVEVTSKSTEYSGSITIPATVTYNSVTYRVTSIGDNAFYDCYMLTSVTIPNSVTSIGKRTFYSCTSLSSINVDAGNTHYASLDGVLFNYAKDTLILCPSGNARTTYTIPNSVTCIGEEAFCDCTSLITINLPNSVIHIGDGAFAFCSSLTSVTIPNSVTSIGSYAFYWCYSLTTITLPNSVTSIGGYAFDTCTSLTSITIPNSVTSIGSYAFSSCRSLTSITIPNSVTSIGSYAFSYCYSLTTITIPNSVTSIGNYAFSGCTSLPVENNLRYADSYLVEAVDRSTITGTIRDGTRWIGHAAFCKCPNLTSIIIPSSVICIGDSAFDNPWISIINGTVQESIKLRFITCFAAVPPTANEKSFARVNTSIPVYVPAESIESYKTAEGWKNFTNIHPISYIDNIITYAATSKLPEPTGDFGSSSGLQIEAFNAPIINHTFSDGIGTITFASKVTSIGSRAFVDCSSLTSINIPSSVTSIGEVAFSYCPSLASINVDPANTHYTSIDGVLFNYAKDTLIQYPIGNPRTTYTLPNSVTNIGVEAFSGCDSLKSVTIPNSVTSIGEGAFSYCFALTAVTIPSSVISIGDWAFVECYSLNSVTIPNSVTSIGYYAFYLVNNIVYSGTATYESDDQYWGAKCLNGYVEGYLVYTDTTKTTLVGCSAAATGSITIPNSVTSIGFAAFVECSSITSITLPNSLTSIGDLAFSGCTSLPVENNLRYADTYLVEAIDKTLSTYTIKDGTKWIGNSAFSYCYSLTSITIPNSVTSIGKYAFDGCKSLSSITLPNSVIRIGDDAFAGCSSLTSLILPNSVTNIGEAAFAQCSSLSSITCYATTPPTCGSSCFYNVTTSIPVYVPSESVDAYKAADQWKDFTNIQALGAEPTIAPDSVITTPTETSITITWPTNDSTFFYDLVVYDADSNVVCIVSFDANGTMTGITYPAPGRYGNTAVAAEEVSIGYRFTITGLDPGTNYTYAVIYKDEEGDITHTESGAFTTKGCSTGVREVQNAECTMQSVSKFIQNGRLVIMKNGHLYTPNGTSL